MSDCTKSVTGSIDDLIVRLDTDQEGRDRLLTVCPLTRRATLTLYQWGRQVAHHAGRMHRGYLITDKTMPNGRRWLRVAAMITASLWLGGCTMQFDAQAHYPGKWNDVGEYQPGSGRTLYKGYMPPIPMDPPAADSPAWYHGMDLGLRN